MVTEIKRVNFFDGQFLKELEFQEEQIYHLHMRRRLNFLLFEQNGVVPISPSDLALEVVDAAQKTFRVRAGMAISLRPTDHEGKEVVLFNDTELDLDAHGIGAGDTAVVTLRYEEEALKDPPSEGEIDGDTRVRENAVIEVHNGTVPGASPNGEPYMVLGEIAFDTMAISPGARQNARLRSALVSAVPALPTISGLTGTTAGVPGGAAVNCTVQGANLVGATAVTFSDPAVTASIGSTTATTVAIQVTIALAATLGPKTFTVTTPAGVAGSPGGVTFTVLSAILPPVISGIDVHSIAAGTSVMAIISGSNLDTVTAVTFSDGNVTAIIQPGATSANLPIQINAAAAAAPASITFTVTNPGGSDNSSGVGSEAFAVQPAAPPVNLATLSPTLQISGGTIDIRGTNIRDAAIASGNSATGTTVELSLGADSKPALNVTARPDLGPNQVVRVTIPDRSGTPWTNTQVVDLVLTFNGSSDSLSFQYDD